MRKFAALFHARNMEFLRDRGTLVWNIAFPLILVFGFAFAFSGDGETLFTVGVLGESELTGVAFLELEHIDRVEYADSDVALRKLRHHQIDLLIDPTDSRYYINDESASGYMAEQLFASLHRDAFAREVVTGRAIRYVDWFVPGLIGMNMMFSGIFGVGFIIVRYRKNGVLKRLKATPVTSLEFIGSQVASRFVIVVTSSVMVFAATNAILEFLMLGSYLSLLVILMMAVVCMISFGLVFATRIKSEELASGLMNIVTLPMIVLSGVFFSLESSPPLVQSVSKAFPLTHFIDGARAIMLDGATLLDVTPNLMVLAAFTVGFLLLSSLLFRWE